MDEGRIERFAQDEVLESLEIRSVPVDPFAIAKSEKVRLLPGHYDGCFDGRLEYRRKNDRGRFYLLYAREERPSRPEGRVRFSVAHELAHYYLPRHRQCLLSGMVHGSKAGFVSDERMEREADYFAAALLMPRRHFIHHVEQHAEGVCTLSDLSSMAEGIFRTSLTSTVIRYVLLSFEKCCAVLSKNGRICFTIISEDMKRTGLSWIDWKRPLPPDSITQQAAATGDQRSEGRVDSLVWFDRGSDVDLWEDTVALGSTGLRLTLLSGHGD